MLKEWGVPERITRLRWSGGALTLGTPTLGASLSAKNVRKKLLLIFFPWYPLRTTGVKRKKMRGGPFGKAKC